MPLPKAPPRLTRRGGAVGLSFLDTSLRQNHVRRITDHLRLIEHGAPTRRRQIDISLALLDRTQIEASDTFSTLRSPVEAPSANTLWVPISRLPREDVAPVDVTDAGGAKARLTQYETSTLLASGLYSLFRSVLRASTQRERRYARDDHDGGAGPEVLDTKRIRSFLQEDDTARWLVQQALVGILTERSATERALSHLETTGSSGEPSRELAVEVLTADNPGMTEFYALLDRAVRDYLVIVALDKHQDEVSLSFEVPMSARDVRARVDHRRGTYRLVYETTLPSSLRSYHLMAETEPEVRIASMTLRTDTDHADIERLAADIETIGSELEQVKKSIAGNAAGARDRALVMEKILDTELQGVAGRLTELLRVRRWQAGAAGRRLSDDIELLGGFATNLADRERTVKREEWNQRAHDVRLLAEDLASENHPSAALGHVYWRRAVSRRPAARVINAHANISIVDAGGSRRRSIRWYVSAVLALQVLLALMVMGQGSWGWDWSTNHVTTPDAVAAVLLLVPGYLYARLDLPDWGCVSGKVRALSRVAGMSTLAAAVVLAMAVAVVDDGNVLKWFLVVTAAAPAVSLMALTYEGRAEDDVGLPRWAA